MYPLQLLRGAIGHDVLIELKNGETYNGKLVNVDTWMNLNMKDVVCTARDGERFWKMDECYVRGSSIKFLRIPDEVAVEAMKEQEEFQRQFRANRGRGGMQNRGGSFRGRGRGDYQQPQNRAF